MKPHKLIAFALLTLSACTGQNNKPDSKKPKVAPPSATSVARSLRGTWRWQQDTAYRFVILGSQCVFLNQGGQSDTQEIRFLDENCNPGARFASLAGHLIHGRPFYVSTWKIKDGRPFSKRCMAIVGTGSNTLSLLDTEQGMRIDYIR